MREAKPELWWPTYSFLTGLRWVREAGSWRCTGRIFLMLCLSPFNGTPLQYSCLENPMDRGAWWAAVHGVAKSRTRLSDFTLTFHFHALEKEMATHSSVLAWRIPGMREPGGLLSMGSHRVRHDRSDLAAAAAAAHLSFLTLGPLWAIRSQGGVSQREDEAVILRKEYMKDA